MKRVLMLPLELVAIVALAVVALTAYLMGWIDAIVDARRGR